jgi:hypothetical protein
MKLLKQAEYMAATGFTPHQAITFRSGLGPYKGQRVRTSLRAIRTAPLVAIAMNASYCQAIETTNESVRTKF